MGIWMWKVEEGWKRRGSLGGCVWMEGGDMRG